MRQTINRTSSLTLLPLLGLLLLVATSCGSRRSTVSRSGAMGTLSKSEVIRGYAALPSYPLADVRGMLSVSAGDKSDLSSGYRMSIYPGEAMVIAARPMGLFEAGRVTLLPDRVILLDKMDRYGVDEALDITPPLPISILDLFGSVSTSRLEEMQMSREPGGYRFTDRDSGSEIFMDLDLNLTGMTIDLPRRAGGVTVSFSHFATISGYRPLPQRMKAELSMPSMGDPATLALTITDYDTKPSMKPDKALPDDYTRLSLIRLLSVILGK